MRKVPVTEAVGLILCHDITRIIPGREKGRAFRKGHKITQEDVPRLQALGKEHIYAWEDMPDSVSLDTLTFEDLGNGITRLHVQSLVESFEQRDTWLASGMETGVNDGYATLDGLLADGQI